jgi:DNA polymerase-1
MIKVQREIEKENLQSKMILQVHDELIFDVHNEEATKLEALVKHNMENAVDLIVPLDVEYKIAENWLEAH